MPPIAIRRSRRYFAFSSRGSASSSSGGGSAARPAPDGVARAAVRDARVAALDTEATPDEDTVPVDTPDVEILAPVSPAGGEVSSSSGAFVAPTRPSNPGANVVARAPTGCQPDP